LKKRLKGTELKKLIAEYREIKIKIRKSYQTRHVEKLEEIKHRYYHETGRTLESDYEDLHS